MFNGIKERVLRFCGNQSDATLLSIEKYGGHIIPVYEDYH